MNVLLARLNSSWRATRQTLIWINVFAIDAVLVGISWQQLLSLVILDRFATLAESLALSLAIWVVYTGDHVLDGLRVKQGRLTSRRHQWHREHGRVMGWLAILACCVSVAVSIATLSKNVLVAGLILAVLVLAYVILVHAHPHRDTDPEQKIWKEPLVGLGYAFGVGLVPLAESADATSATFVLIFASLCTCNCLVVAFAEQEHDRQQGFNSVPLRYPSLIRPLRWALLILGLGCLGGTHLLAWPNTFAIAVSVSAGLLWLAERFLARDEQLVTLADLALIVGAVGGVAWWTTHA